MKCEINRYVRELWRFLTSLDFLDFKKFKDFENLEKFHNVCSSLVQIPHSELNLFFINALKLHYNFVLRPNYTLTFTVFGESNSKSIPEVLYYLDYFPEQNYLIENLKNKVQNYEYPELSFFEFTNLIKKVDREFFSENFLENILQLTDQIFELFDTFEEKPTIPFSVVSILLKDKGFVQLAKFLDSFKDHYSKIGISKENLGEIFKTALNSDFSFIDDSFLSKQVGSSQVDSINFSDLQSFIFKLPENVLPLPIDFEINLEKGKSGIIVAKEQEIETIKELISKFDAKNVEPSQTHFIDYADANADANTTNERDDLTQSSSEEETTCSQAVSESAVEILETNGVESVETGEFKINQSDSFYVSGENSKPIENFETKSSENVDFSTSFREMLGNNKKQFIDELFYGFEEAFNGLVAQIDRSATLDEALTYVNKYFQDYDIYTEYQIAKEFVNLVKRKFGIDS
ncbi:MAG: hypothetical protein N2517_01750 [Ignavibacteria bacterium]|nr:hypothetical protein [Ignavibacteria bacterium]